MDEREGEFAQALGKAWEYIKSDGSFTHKELNEFVNQMDTTLVRQVLRALIYTAWTDHGGKDPETNESAQP